MPTSYSVAESDGFASITVLKQGETTQNVSVEFSTLDGSANGEPLRYVNDANGRFNSRYNFFDIH